MWGFLFGAACLVGLFKVARGGWRHGYGHGHWHGGWGGHGEGRGGYGRSWMFRRLFQRLETTPGQEKVILEAVEGVKEAASKFREESRQARKDVADAFRGEHFDQEKVRQVFAKHDELIEDVKKAVMVGLSKIHEALEPGQRAQLADLAESFGPGGGCRGRFGAYSRC